MSHKIIFSVSILTFILACNSQPKVITADESKPNTATQEQSTSTDNPSSESVSSDVHRVIAEEVLNTSRYTYIQVSEGMEKYWIAISKREITKGNAYLYRGGLKKTNFYSQEFNRTFDVVYLISNFIDEREHPGGNLNNNSQPGNLPTEANHENVKMEGSISISELIKNKIKYKDKKIIVSGYCVKANYQIMGRNWYHLKSDNDPKSKSVDLTVTSQDNIQVGDQVSFEGIIALNKDFGAGYKYEIIMESATLLK